MKSHIGVDKFQKSLSVIIALIWGHLVIIITIIIDLYPPPKEGSI